MGKIKRVQFLLAFAAFLGCAPWLRAGDIVGKFAVAKTDHAVVYLETVAGTFPAQQVKMDQQNKMFIPYVLPVVLGTTVEFHNSDELLHNVFSVGAEEFNLGNWTKGIVRKHTFNKLGEITLLCNVHPEMEAYILVLQNPYFARPDGEGQFRIADVPAGEYVIKAWYGGKIKKQTVKVTGKGSVTVNF